MKNAFPLEYCVFGMKAAHKEATRYFLVSGILYSWSQCTLVFYINPSLMQSPYSFYKVLPSPNKEITFLYISIYTFLILYIFFLFIYIYEIYIIYILDIYVHVCIHIYIYEDIYICMYVYTYINK